MNNNSFSRKSSILIKKTSSGKAKCGFNRTDGYVISDYHAQLVKNGYKVEYTTKGIIISK